MGMRGIERSISFVSPFVYPLLSPKIPGNCGGAEHQFYLFGRFLAKSGWRVSFITSRPPARIEAPGVFEVYFADFSYLGGSKFGMPKDWLTLWKAMGQADADFYVIKVPGHLLAPMSVFTKLKRRSLVFWSQMSHDSNPHERVGMNRLASILQEWGMKRADLVIAQNDEQKRNFKTHYRIEAVVVPSISDRITSMPPSERRGKTVDLLWVGNSSPKKRQEVFFELSRLLPHRTFAIAMNRSDVSRYAQAERTAKGLANVSFLGTLPPVDMESWFAKTRLFLNTSTLEGFPNTFLQSWINGVPVVSLNIDPDGLISQYGIGRVVGKEGVDACNGDFRCMADLLAPLVEELLGDATLLRNEGGKALEFVKSRHPPSVVGPLLIKALEQSENHRKS